MNELVRFLGGTLIMVGFLGWITFVIMLIGRMFEAKWRHQRLMQDQRFQQERTDAPRAEWPFPDPERTS